jgi:hypothetical protein
VHERLLQLEEEEGRRRGAGGGGREEEEEKKERIRYPKNDTFMSYLKTVVKL